MLSRRAFLQLLPASAGLAGAGVTLPASAGVFEIFSDKLPDEARQKLHELSEYGLRVVAFTPNDGWLIMTDAGHHFARDIPDNCYERLKSLDQQGDQIRCVAFPPRPSGAWLVITDRGYFSERLPPRCSARLETMLAEGHQIHSVSFSRKGGERWVILSNRGLVTSRLPDECAQMLRNLLERPRRGAGSSRKPTSVTFGPEHGWSVLASGWAFARDMPQPLLDQVARLKTQRRRLDMVVSSANGWAIVSRPGLARPPRDEIREFEHGYASGKTHLDLWQRMARSRVPGAAVAVVVENRLQWASGYGHLHQGHGAAVHPTSLFQAASISKVVSAVGALLLVERGRLDLDEDIRETLNWDIPVAKGVRVTAPPTLRRLLSHQAGFGEGGFAGYRPGETLPTLAELLRGRSRRKHVKVRRSGPVIEYDPGTQQIYSGRGYLVLQKLMQDAARADFAQWMQQHVLDPLGMSQSAFTLKPPASELRRSNVATGHDPRGRPLKGKWHRYPEAAPAGLTTTAVDLTRLLIMINNGGRAESERFLTPGSIRLMLTRARLRGTRKSDRSLGLIVEGEGKRRTFTHGGANFGFRCVLHAIPEQRAGIVVMTNGASADGSVLREEFVRAAARAYGW